MARRILLATIGAPHGVRGEVRVKSFAGEPMALGDYGPLTTKDGRVLEIERLRPAKGDMLVAKFRGVDDRNAAEALKGAPLHVERGALPAPDEDEFYHADLIGLAAVGADDKQLGKVVAVHDYGGGAVLEIAPEGGRPLLVPFTRDAVPDVDIAAGRIRVIPPAEVEGEPEEPPEDLPDDMKEEDSA